MGSIVTTASTFILYQQTPLHVAATEGHEHTVKALLGKTPNVNITDKDGVRVCVVWVSFVPIVMDGQRNKRLAHIASLEICNYSLHCHFEVHWSPQKRQGEPLQYVEAISFRPPWESIHCTVASQHNSSAHQIVFFVCFNFGVCILSSNQSIHILSRSIQYKLLWLTLCS